MLFLKLRVGLFLLLVKLVSGFSIDNCSFATDVLSVLLLAHAVASVEALFKCAVQFLLLLFLLVVENTIDVVHSTFVLLE